MISILISTRNEIKIEITINDLNKSDTAGDSVLSATRVTL